MVNSVLRPDDNHVYNGYTYTGKMKRPVYNAECALVESCMSMHM